MPTVFANGLSILHKGDGLVQTCAIPDVCNTPTPAGPVPIPYVNVAMDSDLADGTQEVKIEGQSGALQSSKLSMSSGDEAGSAGGVVSGKIKGELKWASASIDVKIEGKGAVRFTDVTLHNGTPSNCAFMNLGAPAPPDV